jgi:1-acyl-sn-glycerol-3-phosphate acyltransferase
MLPQREGVATGEGVTPCVANYSPFAVSLFRQYCRRHISKHFHAARILGSSPEPLNPEGGTVVMYANHVGWWDPLVLLVLTEILLPGRRCFGPIDEQALRAYGFFRYLGFFGLRPNSSAGAHEFLRVCRSVCALDRTALCLTPQGRFCDVRELNAPFQPGLGMLAKMLPGLRFLPVAIEYCFWSERTPELLVAVGEVETFPGRIERDEATTRLAARLRATQARLAAAATARKEEAFHTLLDGKSGASFVYDLWRRALAAATGRPFQPSHSAIGTSRS